MSDLLVFDYDTLLYPVGFATETRYLKVTHKASGREKTFKNRTEFWGVGKKIGGWLEGLNQERAKDGLNTFSRDEFIVEDVQVAGPLENTLHSLKIGIQRTLDHLGSKEYLGYIGEGESFRLGRSTLMKYKGNRDNALRPLQKEEMIDYLISHHNGKGVRSLEADDWVNITSIAEGGIAISNDKDTLGCPTRSYNPSKPENGVIDGKCLGELFKNFRTDSKGNEKFKDVKGFGRKFFYFQVLAGDPVDNYKPNCMSDVEFGDVSAYEALEHCKTDQECFKAIADVYKRLYPEEKVVKGWRGEDITINWMYVLNEMWDMARMLRSEDDFVTADKVFKPLGLWED